MIAETCRCGRQRGGGASTDGVFRRRKFHYRGVVHRNVLGSRILTSKLVRDGQGDRLAAGGCPAEGGEIVLGADQRTVAIRPSVGIGRMFWIVIGGQRRRSRQLQFSVDTDIAVAVVRDGGFNVGVDHEGVGVGGSDILLLAACLGFCIVVVGVAGEDVRAGSGTVGRACQNEVFTCRIGDNAFLAVRQDFPLIVDVVGTTRGLIGTHHRTGITAVADFGRCGIAVDASRTERVIHAHRCRRTRARTAVMVCNFHGIAACRGDRERYILSRFCFCAGTPLQ